MSTPRVAAEILVAGRVQGVGFREFTQRKATQLGLTGFVANLKTGQVRIYAEGPREVIEELTHHLQKGPPLARVESAAVRWMPATGRFSSFGVRFAEFEP